MCLRVAKYVRVCGSCLHVGLHSSSPATDGKILRRLLVLHRLLYPFLTLHTPSSTSVGCHQLTCHRQHHMHRQYLQAGRIAMNSTTGIRTSHPHPWRALLTLSHHTNQHRLPAVRHLLLLVWPIRRSRLLPPPQHNQWRRRQRRTQRTRSTTKNDCRVLLLEGKSMHVHVVLETGETKACYLQFNNTSSCWSLVYSQYRRITITNYDTALITSWTDYLGCAWVSTTCALQSYLTWGIMLCLLQSGACLHQVVVGLFYCQSLATIRVCLATYPRHAATH